MLTCGCMIVCVCSCKAVFDRVCLHLVPNASVCENIQFFCLSALESVCTAVLPSTVSCLL